MPPPKPANIREEVLKLSRAGHSTRAIEEILGKRGIKVGRSTVSELMRLARAGAIPTPAPSPAPSPSVTAPASPSPGPKGRKAASSPVSPPPPRAPVLDLTSFDPGAVADMDLAGLVKLVAFVDTNIETAVQMGDARLLQGLVSTRLLLAKEIARLRPPVLPDPAKDPANASARDELRARLNRAVNVYQRSAAGLEQLRAHLRRVEDEAARAAPPAPAAPSEEGASA